MTQKDAALPHVSVEACIDARVGYINGRIVGVVV
jgi:hypothetical protein